MVEFPLIEPTISRLLAARPVSSSICPSEVARALASADQWRAEMTAVREVARAMAADGRLRITRGGADIDLTSLHHGAIRLARGPRFLAD
jgi:Protein of unknown function (DUF3253)